MERFFVLQNTETGQYFVQYLIKEYWTNDIKEASKFEQKDNIVLDEFCLNFLAGKTMKIVEIIMF